MKSRKLPGQLIQRKAGFLPETINEDKRTVEVTWTTGARVMRFSWIDGRFYEELDLSKKAVRLERLNNGSPLLNTHSSWELRDVIGVVEKASIKDGLGHAVVRFSDREDVEPIWRDVKNGILRNISVGYRVYKYRDVTEKNDEHKVMRAIDWEPVELSFVPVPADAGAQVRSGGHEPYEMEIETRDNSEGSEEPMKVESKENKPAEAQTRGEEKKPEPKEDNQPAKVDEAAIRKEAMAEERKRQDDIRVACRKAGLGEEFTAKLCAKDITLDEARSEIIDAIAANSETNKVQNQVRVEAGAQDEIKTRAMGIENAILHRAQPGKVKLEEYGRRFSGLTLMEVARKFLEESGVSTEGMGRERVAQLALRGVGYHSTSDFPEILANTASKALLAGYERIMLMQTFRPIVKVANLPDFKTVSRVRLGEMPSLLEVPEGAEIKRGSTSEHKESYNLATYARIFAITDETIINDDLNAFTDLPSKFGAAAARLESDIVWALITANGSMGDSNNLFSSAHGNYTSSGTAISVASLGVARKLMRKQKGMSNKDFLNIIPRYLIVPAEKETLAQQFVAQNVVADQAGNTNPFAGSMKVIAEPRLDDNSTTSWYLAADPNEGVDIIEIGYLDGAQGPQTATKVGWDVNGVEIKAKLHFGATVLDWRGLYKNAGA